MIINKWAEPLTFGVSGDKDPDAPEKECGKLKPKGWVDPNKVDFTDVNATVLESKTGAITGFGIVKTAVAFFLLV